MQNTNAPRRPRPAGWLSREELAAKKGMGISNIDQMTIAGKLPPPTAWNSRCILYNEAEVEAHMRAAAEAKAPAPSAQAFADHDAVSA